MAGEGLFVLLFVAFAVVAPLVLWQLVQAEREDRQVLDRESAERVARRDTREGRRGANGSRGDGPDDELRGPDDRRTSGADEGRDGSWGDPPDREWGGPPARDDRRRDDR